MSAPIRKACLPRTIETLSTHWKAASWLVYGSAPPPQVLVVPRLVTAGTPQAAGTGGGTFGMFNSPRTFRLNANSPMLALWITFTPKRNSLTADGEMVRVLESI